MSWSRVNRDLPPVGAGADARYRLRDVARAIEQKRPPSSSPRNWDPGA